MRSHDPNAAETRCCVRSDLNLPSRARRFIKWCVRCLNGRVPNISHAKAHRVESCFLYMAYSGWPTCYELRTSRPPGHPRLCRQSVVKTYRCNFGGIGPAGGIPDPERRYFKNSRCVWDAPLWRIRFSGASRT